jgi:4-hydroxy 2-oxovalerate aldolase
MKDIKILDCTLRDGGYYNNWDFSKDLVNDYLKAIADSGIKYVELGFRSLKENKLNGPNFFSRDSYINILKIPKSLIIGVMINISEIINSQDKYQKVLSSLFQNQKKSKIKFIRLATHFNEISETIKICEFLKKKKFKVIINLMQITEQSENNIITAVQKIKKAKPDVLYFADSLGAMDSEDVSKCITLIKKNWNGEIGIHTHNNLGKAVSNSLSAIKNGVTWIDSTVTGMGRGPGNSETEYMLIEMDKFSKKKYDILPITKIIKKYFEPLKDRYRWGPNPFYYLAGKHGIHPTYIQEMLTMQMDEIEMLDAIKQLKKKDGNKYDVNLVKSEFQKPIKLYKGNWSPKNKIKNKEVLLLSSGPKLNEYKKEIEKFITLKKPFVIALNTQVKINKKLIDLHVACNPLKLMAEAQQYKNITSPLVVPISILSNQIREKLKKVKILDYGVGLKDSSFKFYDSCSNIPKLYTVAYALSIAASGKAKKIYLAGFDGYQKNDRRLKIIDEIFHNYSKAAGTVPVIAVTPSIYNIQKKSIYTL